MTIKTKINPTEALARTARATKDELQKREKESRDVAAEKGNKGVAAYLKAAMR